MPNLPNYRRQAMGDVVPAMLEPGEFVINRNAVNALGVDNLEVLNESGGAHSAIDRLIASATLASALQKARPPHYQEGGQVRGYQQGDLVTGSEWKWWEEDLDKMTPEEYKEWDRKVNIDPQTGYDLSWQLEGIPDLSGEELQTLREAHRISPGVKGQEELPIMWGGPQHGASMFAPGGGYSEAYLSEVSGIPMEEMAIDTSRYEGPRDWKFRVSGPDKTFDVQAGDVARQYWGDRSFSYDDFLRYGGVALEGQRERVGVHSPREEQRMKFLQEAGMQGGGLAGYQQGVGGYRNGGPVKKKGIHIGNYQDGGEVGSAPTFGSKSLAFLDKQMDRLGIVPEERDVYTKNIYDWSRQVRNVESDNNPMAAAGTTSAKGVYQFTDASVDTGRNRMANLGFEDKFTSGISSNPQKWSDEQADSMFLANMFAQKGSDKYLSEIGRGDEKARQEAYYKFHHTNPDEATTSRVNKLMPYTAERSDMSGSVLGYQQGGAVEQLQYTEPQVQGNSLMGMSNDRRVMPVLPPDEYVMRQENGEMTMSRQQVPKLSTAYMAALGMETPLSKRQRNLLQRRALNPESMSPQLRGLLGKVLLQRLGNEPE